MKRGSLWAAVFLTLSLAAVLLASACSGSNEAVKTKGAASDAYGVIQGAWMKYDDARQTSINAAHQYREDAKKALAEYRASPERTIAVKVLNAIFGALVQLDRAITTHDAAKKGDLAGAIANVWLAIGDAVKTLTQLGVPLPPIGGAP